MVCGLDDPLFIHNCQGTITWILEVVSKNVTWDIKQPFTLNNSIDGDLTSVVTEMWCKG